MFRPAAYIYILIAAILCGIGVVAAGSDQTWVILSLFVVTGFLSLKFPSIIIFSFVLATLIIPNEILPSFSGQLGIPSAFGSVRLHPAGIIIFMGSIGHVFVRLKRLASIINSSKNLKVVCFLFLAFFCSAIVQTFAFRGVKGIPQLLENYLFPFVFFLFLLTVDDALKIKYLKFYILVIVGVTFYGFVEFFIEKNLLYGKAFIDSGNVWYKTISYHGYRICTTIGHPLKNAVYFLFAIPFVFFGLRKPYNFLWGFVLLMAIMMTGSRAGFLIAIFCMIVLYYKYKLDFIKNVKTIMAAVAIFLISFSLVIYSPIGTTLKKRYVVAEDSSLVRIHSMQSARTVITNNFFTGKGIGNSFKMSEEIMKREGIGFENPWIMLISDVGFLTLSLYLSLILIIGWNRRYCLLSNYMLKPCYISYISFLLMCSAFNSFGSRNTLNFLFWFIISLLYIKDAALAATEGSTGNQT